METRTYNLFLQDSLFDPGNVTTVDRKKASYRKYAVPDSKVLYKIWIYLAGRDLPYVQSVKYHLHPSFRVREYQIEKSLSNPNYALIVWTWGIFNVKAEVQLISGETLVLNHFLTYADSISAEDIIWENAPSGSLATG